MSKIFDTSVVMPILYAMLAEAEEAAKGSPKTCALCALAFIGALCNVGLEWELFFRLFQNLSGDGEYWSPHLMAFTSLIFIVGFHLIAKENPHSFAVRFIENASVFLIPFYVLGAGLIVADMILGDSSEGFTGSGFDLLEEEAPKDTNELEAFIQTLFQKAGKLGFAVGIGGLAILNLFIAHKLLSYISTSLPAALSALSERNALKDQVEDLERNIKARSEAEADLADFDLTHNKDRLLKKTVSKILGAIQQGLSPHEKALKDTQLTPQSGGPKPPKPGDVDPKTLEKMVEKIRAINADTILKAIKS